LKIETLDYNNPASLKYFIAPLCIGADKPSNNDSFGVKERLYILAGVF